MVAIVVAERTLHKNLSNTSQAIPMNAIDNILLDWAESWKIFAKQLWKASRTIMLFDFWFAADGSVASSGIRLLSFVGIVSVTLLGYVFSVEYS